jgi:Protein of unknown function (DUF2961).
MLSELTKAKKAVTRSICAENPNGAKAGGARAEVAEAAAENDNENFNHPSRELGKGWKVRPCIDIPAGETVTLADIEDSGTITQMWMTCFPGTWRSLILRMYWDGQENPSVEVPVGDFFCNGWCERSNVTSATIGVNPAGGFNSYWQMPFRKNAVITIENIGVEAATFFYQINYELCEQPEETLYFHAFWNRTNPLPYKEEYVIVDNIKGRGHYVGTYMAWGVNNNGWWGEGEIKFFMDGDKEYPTICGTGTEDYFGGAWNFEHPAGQYGVFSNLYCGLHQTILPNGLYKANTRFGMYRWHVTDPIRFEENLKVTIQALGWRSEGRFLPLQDDLASTAIWYQTLPHATFRPMPNRNHLEVI